MQKNGFAINPNDPLHSDRVVPDRTRELFEAFSKCAHGFSASEVASAAINMLVNALRQSYATRDRAERAFDEAAGKAKHVLLERHYHGDGSRRNIFPHTQEIEIGPPDWSKATKIR